MVMRGVVCEIFNMESRCKNTESVFGTYPKQTWIFICGSLRKGKPLDIWGGSGTLAESLIFVVVVVWLFLLFLMRSGANFENVNY